LISFYLIVKSVKKEAKKLNLEANFKSKPFTNDYASSMHIHFNFLEDNDAEKYARILCHYLPLTITAFLPKEDDYQRLDSKFMAPTHISYGGNNRTTLIRIPDSLPKRVEHRLASAVANSYEVYAILSSIYSGLKHPQEITKLDIIYGNA
jgi:glutamine synthetase